MVSVLDIGALLFTLLSIIVSVVYSPRIGRFFRLPLQLILFLTLLICLSNSLEWTYLTSAFDEYEDYCELISPLLWISFFYHLQRDSEWTELEEVTDHAKSANLAKSNFLASISHEIRTPLTNIIGYAHLLADDPNTSTEFVITIQRNAEYLGSLINDVIDLEKIERGDHIVKRHKIDLLDEISSAFDVLHSLANVRKISVEFQFECPLPQSITSDPTTLKQIIINIGCNAIRACGKNGNVLVHIRERPGENRLIEFEVCDDGCGIKDCDRQSIFTSFYKCSYNKLEIQPGSGLGLPLARQMAQMLGGNVVLLDSKENLGSRFLISVSSSPTSGILKDPQETWRKMKNGSKPPSPFGPNELKGHTFLVVEDDQDIRNLYKLILDSHGGEVTLASNGQQAIDIVQNQVFDLILMDIQMPILNGHDTIRYLRNKLNYQKPIIAVSANALLDEKNRCLSDGFTAYIPKPTNQRDFVKTLTRFLSTDKT